MRPRLAAALALVVPALLQARAHASSCYLGPDLLSSATPKLGCPIVVSRSAYFGTADPVVRAIRNTDNLDVTGAITRERRDIVTPYYQFDCEGLVVDENDTVEPYDIFTIDLSAKAQVGDTIYTDGLGPVTLQPAGECDPVVEPMPFCNVMAPDCHYDYDDKDDPHGDDTASVGCMSAGGGATNAGSMMLVLGLAFVARRARR